MKPSFFRTFIVALLSGALLTLPAQAQTVAKNVQTTGSGSLTDNAIVRWDGANALAQNSVLIVADTTGALSGFGTGAGVTYHGGGTVTGASGALTIAPLASTNLNITLSSGALRINADAGTSGYVLQSQGAGSPPIWAAVSGSGLGDFSGPASSTANAIVRFSGTSGKNGQNSAITIADTTGAMTWATGQNTSLTAGDAGANLVLGNGSNGGAALVLPGTGGVVLGTSNTSVTSSTAVVNALQIVSNRSALGPGITMQRAIGATNAGPSIYGTKTRTSTVGDYSAAVVSGDFLLTIFGEGSDGVDALRRGASIVIQADGTFSPTSAPSFITMGTTPTGSVTVSEAVRITSTQNVLIGGTTNISGSGGLKVFGNTTATNTTSGSLINAGGFGNAGPAYIGGNLSAGGATITVSSTRSGPGAVPVTQSLCKVTTTGTGDALTLADGVDGQRITIVHDVDGGSFVLTPTTKTGFSTYTSTAVGESISLVFVTTRGWMVIGSYLGTIAP